MECRQCGKAVGQTEGKKARLFCGDACRKAHARKSGQGEKQIRTSRLRSREGKVRAGDEDYPEQTGLNTCRSCGKSLEWDVLDYCLQCSMTKELEPLPVTPGGPYNSRASGLSNHTLQGQGLIDYLERHAREELQVEGYWIPSWKHTGKTYAEAV